MRVVALLSALFVAAAMLPAPSVRAQQQKFPDLYNLGPIGGKASAVAQGLPGDAKSGLKVEQVYAKAPGDKAGLKKGDVIYGAGNAVFKENAYLELADAILKAEGNAEDSTCKLKVKRGEDTQTLSVKLTHYADAAARKKAILDAALKWLDDEQDSEGGFHSTISPEVSQVVLTSLAGLCWLSAGHKPGDDGPYADNIEEAAAFVMEYVGEQKHYTKLNGKNNDQTNWSLGYGGIFLAHVYASADEKWLRRSSLRRLESKLKWIRKRIFKQAEDDGGFAAGPGGENVLGYVHLEIVSNFCLAALGCMQQAEIEVDEEDLEPLLKYVESCQMPDGGIGYAHDKKWFSEVGRTAGAMNAFATLGATDRESYPKMLKYFEANREHAFGGHSTPTMHQLNVAIAAQRHGMQDKYWEEQRREFTMVRNPDHTFAYRPTTDTQRLGTNLDRDLAGVWTTSHWVLVMCLEDGGLPLWVGSEVSEEE